MKRESLDSILSLQFHPGRSTLSSGIRLLLGRAVVSALHHVRTLLPVLKVTRRDTHNLPEVSH